jgi:hypothetical protein
MNTKKYSMRIFFVSVVLPLLMAACSKDSGSGNDIQVFTATGDVNSKLNEFRQVLGPTLNTAPGATGGHREVNWDGVPDSLIGKPLPTNFFNPVGTETDLAGRQRGLVYAGVGGQFIVSKQNFKDIDPAFVDGHSFSGTQTFSNVSSNLWQIEPEVAGQAVSATVKGFGIVFSDVDVDNSTSMEFFNESRSLGKFFVPKHDNNTSFSFLGVYFKNEKVTSIKVGHDGPMNNGDKDVTQGGTKDLVILDDFLYDEPVKK